MDERLLSERLYYLKFGSIQTVKKKKTVEDLKNLFSIIGVLASISFIIKIIEHFIKTYGLKKVFFKIIVFVGWFVFAGLLTWLLVWVIGVSIIGYITEKVGSGYLAVLIFWGGAYSIYLLYQAILYFYRKNKKSA